MLVFYVRLGYLWKLAKNAFPQPWARLVYCRQCVVPLNVYWGSSLNKRLKTGTLLSVWIKKKVCRSTKEASFVCLNYTLVKLYADTFLKGMSKQWREWQREKMRSMGLTEVSNGRVSDLIFHTRSFLTNSRERCQGPDTLTLADHIDVKSIFHVPKCLTNGSFIGLSISATFGGCECPPAVPDHPSTFPGTSCPGHWVRPAHLTLPAVHLGSVGLTSNDWLTDLFTVYFHSPYVLGATQQECCSYVKPWCGLSSLKSKLIFKYRFMCHSICPSYGFRR